MNYTLPDYYRQFSCLAGACPDTCCAGWGIAIDRASLNAYRHCRGNLGNRLRNSIDWKKGEFLSCQGRCTFLNEENLCDLYIEGGPGMLCRTCRMHPRHVEEFEGVREISLCISCIEAARIVLGQEEPVRFRTFERPGREEDYGDFDFLLYTKLTDARELAFRILQNRQRPWQERVGMALSLAHDLQRRISRNTLFDADRLLSRYAAPGAPERFAKKLETISRTSRRALLWELTRRLCFLEPLKSDWPGEVRRLRAVLYGGEAGSYASLCRSFETACQKTDGAWERWMEQLMVYFVFTYFCGAVYDERAYARMAFGAVCLLLVRELFMALACEQPQADLFELLLELAHRFCREIEHSDENRERVMSWAGRIPLERLLGAVW